MIERVSSAYEHALQAVYLDIGDRGIRVSTQRLEEGGRIIDAEIRRNLAISSAQWGCNVFVGASNAPSEDDDDDDDDNGDSDEDVGGGAVNINSTRGRYALLAKLKELGYNVPKVTQKNSSTGDYDARESTGELALQKILSENQFGYPGGDPAIRAVLKIRELGKLKSSYFNALLYSKEGSPFFLSNYNVAGTLTGRRSSKRHTFGFGNNAQNFPKHSQTASLFRRCLIPRSGNVFLFVDQIQAEDWPVNALAGNLAALEELKNDVDRHSKLASIIFNRRVPAKGDPDWNTAIHGQDRYIGKKARHASNYGMDAPRFSDVLAQEAQLSVSIAVCKQILQTVDSVDPLVKAVFHKYVQTCITANRMLVTPFGRERQFLSCRPNDANNQIFKEAYAYIPQSVVGDNTGFAVLSLETSGSPRYIVQEGHDSISADLPRDSMVVYEHLLRTELAFARKIRFYNGIEITIPIEAEVGSSFEEAVRIKKFTLNGVKEALEQLADETSDKRKEQITV